MTKYITILSLIFTIFLCSCKTQRQVVYFQDAVLNQPEEIVDTFLIRIKPNDKITVAVNCADQRLFSLFNKSRGNGIVPNTTSYNSNQYISIYDVDAHGDMEFPHLGMIHAAGLSREELARTIKNKIIESPEGIKGPTVTVEFYNLNVRVIGEVNKPGSFYIDRDVFTVIDAISKAGDLTIYGLRENVKVLRTTDSGEKEVYELNLCSMSDVYSSPAFYLQQNDIVYVEPNKMKARQSTANGNNFVSASFWVSIASFLTTIGVALSKL